MNCFADLGVRIGQRDHQEYEYPSDIFGVSEYVASCLRNELMSFLKRRGVDCQHISAKGYNILVSYTDPNGCLSRDIIRNLMKQFLKEKLSTIRVEMIPDVSIDDEEGIKEFVKKHSKQYVLYSSVYSLEKPLCTLRIQQILCGT